MTDTTAGEGVRYVGGRLDMTHAPSLGRYIAKSMASEVSGNRQPCMSGDNRDRLHEHVRHRFDRTCETVASEILKDLAAQQSAGARGEAVDPHNFDGKHPISRRLGGFAQWLTWCLEGKFKLAETAPKFVAGMRDDIDLAARLLATPAQTDTGDVAALREALEAIVRRATNSGGNWYGDVASAALSKPNAPGREG